MTDGLPEHYTTLGVGATASDTEIRAAFRRLARQYHPDVNPDPSAVERFRAVVTAYETLSDPARRTAYDTRRVVRGGGSGSGSGGWSTGTRRGTGAGRASGTAGTGPGVGGASSRPRTGGTSAVGGARGTAGAAGTGSAGRASVMPPVRGLDRHSTVRVSAEVVGQGGTASLSHRRWEHCERCGGFGRLQEEVPCQACGGSGFHGGRMSDPCKVCWTSGTTTVCPDCAGHGGLWRARQIVITIPPGTRYGQQLRLRGMGDAGPRGGQPGDLYVEVASPLPAAVQAVASHELVQAALRRLEEWLDRFAPYPAR